MVHSFYSGSSASGENQVVESQTKLLRSSGHEVQLVSLSTDDLSDKSSYAFRSALTVLSGVGPSPLAELESFRPDVTVVHNLHPNFGSNWMRAWNGPIVRVLHNYRLFCANGIFFRDGNPCLKCVQGSALSGVRHSCYRESAAATLPLTIAQIRRTFTSRELNAPDLYIALSEKASQLLSDSGLSSSKIRVVPNFVEDSFSDFDWSARASNNRWIAVGRLTPEKGFLKLVQEWPDGMALDVIGDGPDLPAISEIATKKQNIRVVGRIPRTELLKELANYEGGIVSSLCYEVAPLTALEFMSAGLPVISTSVNASAVTIRGANCGEDLPTLTTDALLKAMDKLSLNRSEYSQNARQTYLAQFTPKVWERKFTTVLEELGNNRSN